jgi:hypothetical protein
MRVLVTLKEVVLEMSCKYAQLIIVILIEFIFGNRTIAMLARDAFDVVKAFSWKEKNVFGTFSRKSTYFYLESYLNADVLRNLEC